MQIFKRDVHWSVIFPSPDTPTLIQDRVAQVVVSWLAANEDFFLQNLRIFLLSKAEV